MKQPIHIFGVISSFLILLFGASVVSVVLANIPGTHDDVVISMPAIAHIESSNRPHAVSYRGAKYGRGLYQVSEICLQDYNTDNRTKLAADALFTPEVCHRVAHWYITQKIPRILTNWGVPVTVDNVLWAYNAGVGNVRRGRMPEETKKYIEKYRRVVEVLG